MPGPGWPWFAPMSLSFSRHLFGVRRHTTYSSVHTSSVSVSSFPRCVWLYLVPIHRHHSLTTSSTDLPSQGHHTPLHRRCRLHIRPRPSPPPFEDPCPQREDLASP